ncbi:MAG: 50S ribosomal protein L20 [Chlorobium sp.]|uniref:Large ribosomal subunit protein bL20 n=1 Tax=Chlorobium phaeobacteroides (strain BS1) TaxID=331678 RepID=RL20_CHLPB|nr:RecName: Full=Large ribosomal subunit protein bL20; AltName: Full=50S ribosomal protein L20 [Chlorobium phaeobacteroides BS1]MBC8524679.1 50S ribosomal protein L20 [Chlorobium phaeobacteroides]MCW8795925.1 50S ribosomal protein L20 [Chlorobium sp.]MCW8819241.1 50S ribosomal protein L20 [Ignavibacteriaceae bacterium]NEX14560.1 50S ribosomal protein L20 [Prosthecochloris sp.]MBL6956555.1 50S ribosomal protein L20 [Chlorobium phaeobacteroides]
MPRATNSVASRARRKRILKKAKGYWGSRGTILTVAKHAVDKAEQYAYRDRRVKKRTFRSLWIMRINAAARENGTSYSRLMEAMNKKSIDINRKALAEIAVKDPAAFSQIVKSAMG